VHDPSLEGSAADDRSALGRVHALADELLVLRLEARERGDPVHVALSARNVAVIGVAEMDGSVDDGLKDSVEVECRLSDRLYDVSNRSFTRLRAPLLAQQVGDLVAKCVVVAHPAPDGALDQAARLRRKSTCVTLGLTPAFFRLRRAGVEWGTRRTASVTRKHCAGSAPPRKSRCS
jgi:hypothetical protein